jgi:DUF3071 family protein
MPGRESEGRDLIKLRLVGPSSDQQHLVFTSKKRGRRGSHLVAVDRKLLAAVGDLVKKRQQASKTGKARALAEEQPRLAPRDIQRLLRAGRPVDQVAKEAGVSVGYVEQFQTPVLYERLGIVRQAQLRHIEKARLGYSSLPLGEAVLRNLRARRVRLDEDELDRAWSATRTDTQPWVVSLTYRYRGRPQRAMWRYNPATNELEAGNRLAVDLGWITDGREAPEQRPRSATRRKPAKRAAPGRTTSSRAARSRRAPAKARRRAPARGRASTRRRA